MFDESSVIPLLVAWHSVELEGFNCSREFLDAKVTSVRIRNAEYQIHVRQFNLNVLGPSWVAPGGRSRVHKPVDVGDRDLTEITCTIPISTIRSCFSGKSPVVSRSTIAKPAPMLPPDRVVHERYRLDPVSRVPRQGYILLGLALSGATAARIWPARRTRPRRQLPRPLAARPICLPSRHSARPTLASPILRRGRSGPPRSRTTP